jgi:hypothetical protein
LELDRSSESLPPWKEKEVVEKEQKESGQQEEKAGQDQRAGWK